MQRLPYPLLKGCALHVKRQRQPQARLLHQRHDLRHGLFILCIRANQLGSGKAALQIFDQSLCIVAQQHAAHTFVRAGDQQAAQRAFGQRKTYGLMLTTVAIGLRRHAQHGRRVFVEAAAGLVATQIGGIGDRLALRRL